MLLWSIYIDDDNENDEFSEDKESDYTLNHDEENQNFVENLIG